MKGDVEKLKLEHEETLSQMKKKNSAEVKVTYPEPVLEKEEAHRQAEGFRKIPVDTTKKERKKERQTDKQINR